jgi:hypothetical protein
MAIGFIFTDLVKGWQKHICKINLAGLVNGEHEKIQARV